MEVSALSKTSKFVTHSEYGKKKAPALCECESAAQHPLQKAEWIHCADDIGDCIPLFKKDFQISDSVQSAYLYISARGVYEASLNGKRVGEFILAPGWTSYKKRIQYQKYDITDCVISDNSLVVAVAPGWYKGRIADWWRDEEERTCALIAKIEIIYASGRIESFYTDTDWKAALSGYSFCEIYDGFSFDARVKPNFNLECTIAEDDTKEGLIAQVGENVIEHERIKPAKIIETPNGETVIDFGQNLTGYVEIDLTACAGDIVSLSFAETLDKDGNFYNGNYRSAKCGYTYICKDGKQTFKPTLTFYGYRYIRLDEYPAEICADNFTSIAVYSELERTGYIETSDSFLNKLFSNSLWGQRSNFLDVPTDCPQRDERMGWTGDAQVFIRAASYNYDVNKFFEKWLSDMVLDQYENGAIPMVIPFEKSNAEISAAWSDAVAICPWQLYLSYGNKEILEKMFLPIKKWVDYVTETTSKPNLWFGGKHFCDWLELGSEDGNYKGDTRGDLIASAFYAKSTEILCKIGDVLGRDISFYKTLHKKIISAFNDEFKNDYKTQTEHILPLAFNITNEPDNVIRSLAELIRKDGNKLQTGFVGTPYILHVLSSHGYSELAYTLLLRKEYPSWIYPITKGATTIWEHWDGIKPDGEMWSDKMNSFNHYSYGAVVDWMYSVCGGINPIEEAPGYERALISPVADSRIDWFRSELHTKHGVIKSAWRHENGSVVYEITTPVDATVIIDKKTYTVEPGSYSF